MLKMQYPKVGIVILQYNNSADSIECLKSVVRSSYPALDIFLVDNGSDKPQLDIISLHLNQLNDERVILIKNDRNLGFSGGNNVGIKKALSYGVDYVLILNNDATISQDLVEKLVIFAQTHEDAGIIGPAINEGGGLVYGGKIDWLKAELTHNKEKLSTDNFYISGACMLVSREVFENISLFDEKFFLYFEDADFCVRARKNHFKLAIVDDTIINHRVSASTSRLGPSVLLRYHYRNAHLFNVKNGPIPIKIILPIWSIYIIIKQFLKILFVQSKRRISLAIMNGVFDFYLVKFGRL